MSTTSPHIDTHLNLKPLEALAKQLEKTWGKAGLTAEIATRELTVTLPKTLLIEVLTHLRNTSTLAFTQLMDLCGVDWLEHHTSDKRFAVVYHLLSLAQNMRIRLKVFVADGEPVPSLTGLYSAAGWYEREAYDMYGIPFEGNPDLRRLLTDYGFEGHPLRKDFPLSGHVETYYDEDKQRVAYKPVDLPQDFREFDKTSDWQAATGNAPLADEDNTFSGKDFQ